MRGESGGKSVSVQLRRDKAAPHSKRFALTMTTEIIRAPVVPATPHVPATRADTVATRRFPLSSEAQRISKVSLKTDARRLPVGDTADRLSALREQPVVLCLSLVIPAATEN
jgi:hypothetical protein